MAEQFVQIIKTFSGMVVAGLIVLGSVLFPQKDFVVEDNVLGKVDMSPDYAVSEGEVLGDHTVFNEIADTLRGRIRFSLPVFFENSVEIETDTEVRGRLVVRGEVVAPNIIEEITAGDGIEIEGERELEIRNAGVLSLQGKTGKVSLKEGTGISIGDDLKISIKLSEGSGIKVSGDKIENTDKGSSQYIFKTIGLYGGTVIKASKNDDSLYFKGGEGIDLVVDTSTSTIEIKSNNPNQAAGWTYSNGVVYLTTNTDKVGLGTSTPTEKLDVVGGIKTTGSISIFGIDNNNSGITNAGSITGATGFTSSGTITFSDLSTGILKANFNGIVSSSAVDLNSADVTNTLPISKGGTGLTSYYKGDIIYASATNSLSRLPIGADGQVLIVSNGVPGWGSITGGTGGVCTNCVVTDPGSTQVIVPTTSNATGLVIRQAQSGTVDVFKITDYTGNTSYFRIDSSGGVILGNGGVATGTFTINPSGSDPISISPSSAGTTVYTGTITSKDLTQDRTWTFPDLTGEICLTAGNCSGTAASLGGSGTVNYLAKWQASYSLTDSLIYDDGTNVGIGISSPSYKLHVVGAGYFSGNLSTGGTLSVTGAATLSNSLTVSGAVDLNSTLGVSGATTLSSTLNVTGNTTIGGNLTVNGTGINYIAGKLGIGVSSPAEKLEVAGNILLPKTGTATSTAQYPSYLLKLTGSAWDTAGSTAVDKTFSLKTIGLSGSGGDSRLGVINNAGSEVFTITESGNVGIGTTSPAEDLKILSSIDGGTMMSIENTVTTLTSQTTLLELKGADMNDSNFYYIKGVDSNGNIRFALREYGGGIDGPALFIGDNYTSIGGDTIYVRVNRNEEHGIEIENRSDGSNAAAILKFDAALSQGPLAIIGAADYTNANEAFAGRFFLDTDSRMNGISFVVRGTDADDDIRFYIGGRASSNIKMIVEETGNVGIGVVGPTYKLQVGSAGDGTSAIANAWNTFSDIRFKENVRKIDNSLGKVLDLEGVYFDWKNTGVRSVGFIAQNVQSILPEVVSMDANGYLSVDYSRLTPVLVEAVKEQQKLINMNKVKIDEFGNIIFPSKVGTEEADNSKESVIDKIKNAISQLTQKVDDLFARVRALENSELSGSIVLEERTKKITVRFSRAFVKKPLVFISSDKNVLPGFRMEVYEDKFILEFEKALNSTTLLNWYARVNNESSTSVEIEKESSADAENDSTSANIDKPQTEKQEVSNTDKNEGNDLSPTPIALPDNANTKENSENTSFTEESEEKEVVDQDDQSLKEIIQDTDTSVENKSLLDASSEAQVE